jgi:hypothetical protein
MADKNNNCCCSRGRDGGCGKKEGPCAGHGTADGGADGCSGGCCGSGCKDRIIYVTDEEKAFLSQLSQIPFLPLARFVLQSSQSDDAVSVALAPVYLYCRDDTPDTVRNSGEILQTLEDKYLVTLDYDLPLENGDYSMYEESRVYRDFCAAVKDGVSQDGVTYDTPVLQRGSLALTSLGQHALDDLE